MITANVISHMDIDELRNLLCIQQEIEGCAGDVIFAKDGLIECLQNAYNAIDYCNDRLIRYNAAKGRLRKIEQELEIKYEKFMPKPEANKNE